MSDNTQSNAPEFSEPDSSPAPEPRFGIRLPSGQGPEVPSWHPEAAPSQPGTHSAQVNDTFTSSVPREDIGRGALFALAALPIGVILWMIIWNLGWMTSLVTYAAAFMAAKFYVTGAGALSRKGVWVVAIVTAATALASFLGGVWLDAVKFLGREPLAMVMNSEPWALMADNFAYNPDFVSGYVGDFLLALLFGALGCFFTLRQLFAATKEA
ncbi:hypothetical protein ACLRGI_01270 [Paenarthrobacter nitroguajacolicus]|uniref:hypothetical protein n=1 Tax=Paenarthrobacter nitroguajacolicus TaxID=211146 RepID=UPI003ADBF100